MTPPIQNKTPTEIVGRALLHGDAIHQAEFRPQTWLIIKRAFSDLRARGWRVRRFRTRTGHTAFYLG